MISSASYKTFPIAEEENSGDDFKSPPPAAHQRTWKKFPPTTVERITYYPDSASTPNTRFLPKRIESLGLSPLWQRGRNPCALSPIDRLKLGGKRRSRELFKSYELNQTCPTELRLRPPHGHGSLGMNDGSSNCVQQGSSVLESESHVVSLTSIYSSNPSILRNSKTPSIRKRPIMEKIRVDGANGLRFSARRTKGCFISSGTGSPYNSSSGNNGSTNAQPLSNTNTATTTSESIMRFSKSSEINPNKAVFTIDSKTSRILIVNKNACELLGYSSKELCEIEFSDLLVNKNNSHVSALAEGQLNSDDGTLVLLSGKVVEMSTKFGANIAVSLWIRQIDNDGRCLAVAEPVERRVAHIVIDAEGTVISGDYEALLLFQMETVEEFCDLNVTNLIPAIKLPDPKTPAETLPKSVYKQKATGRTKDGLSFPLCLLLEQCSDRSEVNDLDDLQNGSDSVPAKYTVTVFVFNNLSGLMVIDESGFIESCNHHFSMLMFGYAQAKIIGQHVSKIIPNFGQEHMGRSRNATLSSSESETDHVERTDLTMSERMSSCAENAKVCLDFSTSKVNSSMVSELSDDISNIRSLSSDTRSMHGQQEENVAAAANATNVSAQKATTDDNSICHENHENNRNLANSVKGSGKRLSTLNNSKPSATNGLDSACENTFEDDFSQVMDNEILTPVNETEYFVGGEGSNLASASSSQAVPRNSISNRSGKGPSSELESVINDLPNTANSSKSVSKAIVASEGHNSDAESHSGESQQQKRTVLRIQDGKYKGEAIHNDGNVIDIIYSVSGQTLPSGRVHCVWVSRDPDTEFSGPGKSYEDALGGEDELEEDDEERNQNLTLTFDSVNSTVENSLGHAIKTTAQNTATATPSSANVPGRGAVPMNSSRPNSMSLLSQCEEELIAGEFSRHYSTLKQIGKGAYGYVKMAYRKTDRLLVIAKFILKEKLCPQFMVLTEEKREIPMEIYLLTTVEHPNIVRVLDVFENGKFYQMVMEKHGCGMDLFEFIDRLPMMDEKLACYIFRQIANAVDYLHSLKILHRDLKDENIIIDQNFQVKLIDFGSATFMEEGKLFSTFYGTTEYCSPEVLAGNKYAGPELEMWSLGVTLYVIMFFENPFVDIEETLHAPLVIPQKVSGQLERLLLSMLDKNPLTRCTMPDLMADSWLNQEINASLFNFSWVVPCETFESNPEKYYNGQVLSSGTAISTTSPQDSLSLADGDSMLDVDGEENEEEDEIQDDDALGEPQEDDGGYNNEEIGTREGDENGDGPTATVVKVIEPKPSQAALHNGEEFVQEEETKKNTNDWTATVELAPKSSNRSNFQILSISYSGGNEDNSEGKDDAYENDSWDEYDDEDDEDEEDEEEA